MSDISQRIETLKEVLRSSEETFDMSRFFERGFDFSPVCGFTPKPNYCGTPSCIAGHIVALFDKEMHAKIIAKNGEVNHTAMMDHAGELIGLDEKQADWLFMARWTEADNREGSEDGDVYLRDMETVTPDEAIAALDHVLAGNKLFDDMGFPLSFPYEGV